MKKFILLLSLLAPVAGFAQTYAIDWYKVAGGGGASAADEVILADDAGTMLDGNNVTQVTFLDVVPDPADWQDYCDAFTN